MLTPSISSSMVDIVKVVSATSGDLTRLLEKEGGREEAADMGPTLNAEFDSLVAIPQFSFAVMAGLVATELPRGGFGDVGEGVGGGIRSG